MNIILASASRARRRLMQKVTTAFTCHASEYEEDMNKSTSPSRLATFLALQKALSLAKKFPRSTIIGADTFGTLKGEKLGKPKTLAQAKSMLQKSSGKTMYVYTGIALIQTDHAGKVQKKLCAYEKAAVTFKTMTSKDIAEILREDPVLETAGALSIEGKARKFIQSIRGDHDSIIGLPVKQLKIMLKTVE